jgi:hypothetical protein
MAPRRAARILILCPGQLAARTDGRRGDPATPQPDRAQRGAAGVQRPVIGGSARAARPLVFAV